MHSKEYQGLLGISLLVIHLDEALVFKRGDRTIQV